MKPQSKTANDLKVLRELARRSPIFALIYKLKLLQRKGKR